MVDLVIMLQILNANIETDYIADINSDGIINILDFALLKRILLKGIW
jgi:hypothetical protein